MVPDASPLVSAGALCAGLRGPKHRCAARDAWYHLAPPLVPEVPVVAGVAELTEGLTGIVEIVTVLLIQPIMQIALRRTAYPRFPAKRSLGQTVTWRGYGPIPN